MRTLTAQEAVVVTKRRRSNPWRVSIKDSTGAFQDFSTYQGRNWIRSAEYSTDADTPVGTASVRLWRDRYSLSLAPLMEASKFNIVGGVYAPLIDSMREIKIEEALLPEGVTPAAGDWREVFRGFVDVAKWSGTRKSSLDLECRDGAGPLQDIVTEREGRPEGTPGSASYGSDPSGRPVEEVMQDVLDDWATPGGYTVVLYTPTGTALDPRPIAERCGFDVVRFVPAKGQSVLETLTILANFVGGDIRWRWSDVTNEFRLEFFAPDRAAASPVVTVAPNQYREVSRLEIDPSTVRNAVRVSYQTDPDDESTRTFTEDEDATSIARYRRRWMEVAEAASSAINTPVEAEAMRDAILADLKDPRAEFSVEAEYRHDIVLGDLVRWSACPGHFDADQDLAVVGIRAKLEEDGGTSCSFTTRGSPCGKYLRWLTLAAGPGNGKGTKTFPGRSPTVTLVATIGGLIASIDAADMVDRDILHWEFHLDTASGFTPSSATRVARGNMTRVEITGLSPATTYYCKVVTVRADGVVATSSAASSGTAPSKLGSLLLEDGSVKNQHVSSVAGDRIAGSKLLAGSGPLTNLDQTSGALNSLANVTTRTIDQITDSGTTYARPLAAALSSGKLKLDSGTSGLSGRMTGANLSTALALEGTLDVAGRTVLAASSSVEAPAGDGTPIAEVWDIEQTNYIVNPSFEVNVTDGWSGIGSPTPTITRDTATKLFGDAAMKIVTTGVAGQGVKHADVVAAATDYWAFALHVTAAGAAFKLRLRLEAIAANGTTVLGTQTADVWVAGAIGTWADDPLSTRVHVYYANLPASTAFIRAAIYENTGVARTFYIDGVSLELSPDTDDIVLTSYCDGDLGSGYAWTGTPHNSTSTRAAGHHTLSALNAAGATGPGTPIVYDDKGRAYHSQTIKVGDGLQGVEFRYDGIRAAGAADDVHLIAGNNIPLDLLSKGVAPVRIGDTNAGTLLLLRGAGTAFPSNPGTGELYFRTDLSVLCKWDGSQWVDAAAQPCWSMTGGAQSNIGAAHRILDLNATSYAEGVTADLTNNRITTLYAGVYLVGCEIAFSGLTTTEQLYVYANSGAAVSVYRNLYYKAAIGATSKYGNWSALVELPAGADVRIGTQAGANSDINSAIFWGCRIGTKRASFT